MPQWKRRSKIESFFFILSLFYTYNYNLILLNNNKLKQIKIKW